MHISKDGLGDATFREISAVVDKINKMNVGDELNFNPDMFETKQLYGSVINAITAAGFKCELSCVVYRWFRNGDGRTLVGDFRNDIIILWRGKNV